MLKRMQNVANNPKVKKFGALLMCMMICCSMFVVCAFAADGVATTEPTPSEAASQVFNTIHEQLNFTTILSVIAVALSAALSIYLGWWAIRKVSRMVFGAFERGRVRV